MNPIARSWWRHRMESFSALLAICAGNSPASGEFPTQRPVTRSFDVFCDLCLNTRLRKQSWGWWFETLSRPLWRHRNGWVDAPLLHNHASWMHLKSLPDLMQPQILATMWIYNYQNRNNSVIFCSIWYWTIVYQAGQTGILLSITLLGVIASMFRDDESLARSGFVWTVSHIRGADKHYLIIELSSFSHGRYVTIHYILLCFQGNLIFFKGRNCDKISTLILFCDYII